MNKNELYHYGVPGMRWGRRRATRSRHGSKTSAKPKEEKLTLKKTKKKMSAGKKIAIGGAVAGVTLAGIGTMLSANALRKRHLGFGLTKAFLDNM